MTPQNPFDTWENSDEDLNLQKQIADIQMHEIFFCKWSFVSKWRSNTQNHERIRTKMAESWDKERRKIDPEYTSI